MAKIIVSTGRGGTGKTTFVTLAARYLESPFLLLTDRGFIKCDCAYLRTKVRGVFVAGDCRVGAAMQLATAVGDGIVAAMMLKQYFRDPNWWNEPVSDLLQPGGW